MCRANTVPLAYMLLGNIGVNLIISWSKIICTFCNIYSNAVFCPKKFKTHLNLPAWCFPINLIILLVVLQKNDIFHPLIRQCTCFIYLLMCFLAKEDNDRNYTPPMLTIWQKCQGEMLLLTFVTLPVMSASKLDILKWDTCCCKC